jgi:uncharacterized protein (DUF1330 family)
VVLLEFDNADRARAWYDSPEYEKIKSFSSVVDPPERNRIDRRDPDR